MTAFLVVLLVIVAAVTWLDEGSPWAVFHVEEIVYYVDIEECIQAEGP